MKTSIRYASLPQQIDKRLSPTQYGVLICLRCHNYKKQDVFIGTSLLLIIPCHLLAAYNIELAAAKQAKSQLRKRSGAQTPTPTEAEHSTWKVITWLHGLNATLCLLIASVVVYYYIHHPLIGTVCEFHAIVVGSRPPPTPSPTATCDTPTFTPPSASKTPCQTSMRSVRTRRTSPSQTPPTFGGRPSSSISPCTPAPHASAGPL